MKAIHPGLWAYWAYICPVSTARKPRMDYAEGQGPRSLDGTTRHINFLSLRCLVFAHTSQWVSEHNLFY